MKKVLFATTALVASAGIASAQGVELSGHAEMGIIGGSAIETQFEGQPLVKAHLLQDFASTLKEPRSLDT